MPTNPGQGNGANQGNYAGFPPGGTTTNVYIYTVDATPVVGSNVFWTSSGNINSPAGTYRITLPSGVKRKITVNASGVVTAVSDCTWTSSTASQSYAPVYTGTRNNCGAGSTASTITINNGTYSFSGYTNPYVSYISQEDANTQAQNLAIANFNANVQNYINTVANCTWTSTQGASCSGDFTRNNCGSNCYGTTVTYTGGGTATRTSILSQSDADTAAYNAAYSIACSNKDANGQNYANTNGGCCCWVSDPACVPGTCNYMGDRQRNTCTGEYRYTNYTSTASCNCGETCANSYFVYSCMGQYNYDRYREERWTCTNNIKTANTLYQSCSASCNANSSPVYENQNYTTCYNCSNVTVYKDINHCSGTSGAYYVYSNGYVNVGSQPTGVGCNTDSQCSDTGSAYCSGGNYVINVYQANSCSGASCTSPRVIEYNSTTYGCVGNCYTYNIIAYNTYSTVTGTYTNCSGSTNQSFSFTSGSSTGFVGTVCARSGSVSVNSGNGRSENSNSSCGTYPLS